MFHRIIHDHWTEIVPIVGFVLTFAVFLAALIRTLIMQKSQVQHLASLPLEEKKEAPQKPDGCQCDKSCGCCLKKKKPQ